MARPGRSTQPCHGCGSSQMHRTGRVCDECAAAIRGYADIMAQRAAVKDAVIMVSKERSYALPHLRHAQRPQGGGDEPIAAGFLEIEQALSTPVEGYHSGAPKIFDFAAEKSSRQGDWDCYVRINPDHAHAIGRTYEAVRIALLHAYSDGFHSGRDLLNQLARGDITADEFNTVAARTE